MSSKQYILYIPFFKEAIVVFQLLSRVQLCDPMDCSTPGFPVLHCPLKFAQTRVESVIPSNHLILCRPLVLPSILG